MQNNRELKPMLTANEVAHLLNVHINTVRRWSNQGLLKTYRIGGRGDRRFEREDVIKFHLGQSKLVESGRRPPPLSERTEPPGLRVPYTKAKEPVSYRF